MKCAIILLPALAALCSGAALPREANIAERDQGDNVWKRQVIVTVTKTATKTTPPGISTTSTKYTTLTTPVVTKTSTITKPYSSDHGVTTVIVTVTGKPTTLPPATVTVTVTAKTSSRSSAKPPVTVTVTVPPPDETDGPEPTPENPWQITRTLPPLTLRKREPTAAPEAEADPQRWHDRPTHSWGPGGPATTVVQTVKETVTYYPPGSTKTVYYTPPPPGATPPISTVYVTYTLIPTVSAGPVTVTKTLTPYPTSKAPLTSTLTIWDGAKNGKRSPQSLGEPSRSGGLLPTETEIPDPEDDPETSEPGYPDSPTFVLGSPTRTVNVSPTPVAPVSTYTPPKPSTTLKPTVILPPQSPTNSWSLGQPTRTVNVSPTPVVPEPSSSTKKPWWYYPPKTVTITKWIPSPTAKPTGTLIQNTATLPVLTLGEKRRRGEERRQNGNADVTRSATFVGDAPVKTIVKTSASVTTISVRTG